jgi:WD40 repeat protein
MNTTIQFTCPQCSNTMQLPVSAVGQQGKCAKCGTVVKVSSDESSSAAANISANATPPAAPSQPSIAIDTSPKRVLSQSGIESRKRQQERLPHEKRNSALLIGGIMVVLFIVGTVVSVSERRADRTYREAEQKGKQGNIAALQPEEIVENYNRFIKSEVKKFPDYGSYTSVPETFHIDVAKTNSLISPFVGTCIVNISGTQTIELERDSVRYQATYEYVHTHGLQNNKWVQTSGICKLIEVELERHSTWLSDETVTEILNSSIGSSIPINRSSDLRGLFSRSEVGSDGSDGDIADVVVQLNQEILAEREKTDGVKPQRIQETHFDGVTDMEISPNGRSVAIGGRQFLQISDIEGKKEAVVFSEFPEPLIKSTLQDLCYSPLGDLLATCESSGVVIIWKVDRGEVLHKLIGHHGSVFCAKFSRDQLHLNTAGEDGTIRLWSVATGKQLRVLTGHTRRCLVHPEKRRFSFTRAESLVTDPVTIAEFNNDFTQVVSAGEDKTIRIWDVQTGKQLQSFAVDEEVRHLALDSTGKRILTATILDPHPKLRNAQTGEVIRVLPGGSARIMELSLNENGRIGVGADIDQVIRIWDLQTGVLLRTLQDTTAQFEYFSFLRISPDETHLYTGTKDEDSNGTIRAWDIRSGLEFSSRKDDRSPEFLSFTFSPDAEFGISRINGTGATIRNKFQYWDLLAVTSRDLFKDPSYRNVVIKNNSEAFTIVGNNKITEHDITSGEVTRSLFQKGVEDVVYSANNAYLLSTGHYPGPTLWDGSTGMKLKSLNAPNMITARFTQDEKMILVAIDRGIAIWELDSLK